jgi:membrane-bound lytic murein transglycosylase D
MALSRSIKIAFLAALGIFLWSCSSAPKPAAAPQKPEIQANPQNLPAKSINNEVKPEEKTIIPPEEKKAAGEQAALQKKNEASGEDKCAILLEEALNFYQEALAVRERGDLDGSQNALDKAFEFILKMDLTADSPLLQQKNDLRLLISQRIQELYAVRRNPISQNHKSIPLVENKDVKDEIALFTGPERKNFEEAYKRAGLYKEWIQDEFRKAGVPEELAWLPMVESWFQVKARSRALAMGMWQFMKSTGYRYGLARDRFVDERLDPYKATKAAMKYLEELHSFFGDWLTALASYNCGEARVQYCINTQNIKYLDDFWELYRRLPVETARYVPRFIAALLIIQNPEKYGMSLPAPYAALKFDTVTINHPTKLSTISAALGLESSELVYLNPELLYESTPDHAYELRVPLGYGDKALQTISGLPKYVPPEYVVHVVKSGQTLSQIASIYGTSVATLMRVNGLRSTLIRVGQKLRIPRRS